MRRIRFGGKSVNQSGVPHVESCCISYPVFDLDFMFGHLADDLDGLRKLRAQVEILSLGVRKFDFKVGDVRF